MHQRNMKWLFFRAKDHEIASYDTEQIVDVPGVDEMQGGGKSCVIFYEAQPIQTIILRNRMEYRVISSRRDRKPGWLKSNDIPQD